MRPLDQIQNKLSLETLPDTYSLHYLKQYWPEHPTDAVAWADNCVLMLSYQDAALAVHRFRNGVPGRMLDVSTGPALAPLMAMMPCVSEVQLSDYTPDNRQVLVHLPIEYWRNYVPTLVNIYDEPHNKSALILEKLNRLRLKNPPVEVDLFRDHPFPKNIVPYAYDIISMQFVADSITNNVFDYENVMTKVIEMVKPGSSLIMSAIVDANHWEIDGIKLPSSNVSEQQILDLLRKHNLKILHLSRSMRHPGLTYSGGWIVLSAARE